MSTEGVAEKKKVPVLKLAVGAGVVLMAVVLVLRGFDVRGAIDRGMEVIRSGGPGVFFVAMALLPALAVPASVFTLTAGPVFAEKLGMPLVVALSIAAVTVNVVITYALAQRALRPFLVKGLKRLGYTLPDMEAGDLTDLTVIVRVTPGIPFFVQNYLLGIAGVPFGKYLLVSCLIAWPYVVGFVVFGDALLNGKGKMILFAVGLLVAAGIAANWVRKRYAKKKAGAK